MRVFISSVRRGLEQERDALPGLIQAVGHIPVRFEDYTALPLPSRQACLDGVASADVYLMLLGPFYGHRFPETGQSPTHDEWVAAGSAGIPRLVFRKTGVEFEPEQEEFAQIVGHYGTGVFYDSFADYTDLAPKVVQVLRQFERAPAALAFAPLAGPISIRWRSEWPENQHRQSRGIPTVEVHVAPVHGRARSARELGQITQGFATRVRRTGRIPDEVALAPQVAADGSISLTFPEPDRQWNQTRGAVSLGVRVDQSGQLSWWGSLPGDGIGAVLDPDDLTRQVTDALKLLGSLALLDTGADVAVALGVDDTMLLTRGSVRDFPRSGASMLQASGRPLRVEPDESVPGQALEGGAAEIAAPLVHQLLDLTSRR
jgi:hypothetical protein